MVTDAEKEIARLREELGLIRGVVDMVPAMLAYWGADQRNQYANRAYETWFGVRPETLVGQTMREFLGPIYELNLPYIAGALRGEPQEFDREIPATGGAPARQSQVNYIPHIVNGAVRGFFVLVADVTHRKKLENELRAATKKAEMLATHDFLTGLPNRVLLEDRAAHVVELARRNKTNAGILFLDLDGFKRVNDTLGHGGGDELLIELPRRLQSTLRKSDTLARFGGDEFVVLLPDLEGREGAGRVAQKLLECMAREPFVVAGRKLEITMSVGVAVFPDHGQDMRALLSNADAALGEAKRRGKNQWVLFTPS